MGDCREQTQSHFSIKYEGMETHQDNGNRSSVMWGYQMTCIHTSLSTADYYDSVQILKASIEKFLHYLMRNLLQPSL